MFGQPSKKPQTKHPAMPMEMFQSRGADKPVQPGPLLAPIKCPHCGMEITPDQLDTENESEQQQENGLEE